MEILQPEQPPIKSEPFEPVPTTEQTPNLTHIQMLSHLDMKDKVFDDSVMEKIAFIAERMDYPSFEELSLKIGNDSWATTKLDKIYYHIKLSDQYMEGEKRQNIIREQLKQYE
jgi:hypothetical protein